MIHAHRHIIGIECMLGTHIPYHMLGFVVHKYLFVVMISLHRIVRKLIGNSSYTLCGIDAIHNISRRIYPKYMHADRTMQRKVTYIMSDFVKLY